MEESSFPQQFLKLFEEVPQTLVVPHSNPDPDALASCLAVKRILEHHFPSKKVTLGFNGIIGRSENRAMRRECGIEMEWMDTLNIDEFPAVVMVDCQYSHKNHTLKNPPLVVIDHHPQRNHNSSEKQCTLEDIRPSYGATSTILYTYLQSLQVPIDPDLATALLYGIKTDTMDLARSELDLEYEAYIQLMKLADKNKLVRILRAPVSKHHFFIFKNALDKAFFLGEDILMVPLGEIDVPEANAEIAEFFIRLERVIWIIAMGFWKDSLYLSVRVKGRNNDAGAMLESSLSHLGSVGGHGRAAGGRIAVLDNTPEGKEKLEKIVWQHIAEYFAKNLEKDQKKFAEDFPSEGKEE